MSATSIDTEIERYLRSGAHDTLAPVWSGGSIIERGANANSALRDALVAEVLRRTRHTTVPDGLDDADLVTLTRTKVAPMVEGLFPAAEQTTVLDMLARSVVYLTPRNIEAALRSEMFLHTTWMLANLYLLSTNAEPLSPDAVQAIGMSRDTTCFVSMRYFRGGDKFTDVVVHEAAHVFHNCKREPLGLPFSQRREWLLDIDFLKRETFAYACEAFSRICELGGDLQGRRRLLAQVEAGPMPGDDSVDIDEYVHILREAVGARNGWRRILKRCAPMPKGQRGNR